MPELTLYHYPLSYSSQIVRLVLAEKRIPYKSVIVDIGPAHENYEPWYMRLNPRGVVPTLQIDDGAIVTNAIAIAQYLDREMPKVQLQPKDQAELDIMEEWIAYQQSFPERELSLGLLQGLRARLARKDMARSLKILARHRDRNPELAAAYDAKIRDVERLRETVEDPDAFSALAERVDALLQRIEERVTHRPYILETGYSLADLVWTVTLARIEMLGLGDKIDVAKRPATARYFERLARRPSFWEANVFTEAPVRMLLPSLLKAYWPLTAAGVVAILALAGVILWLALRGG
jgi:glutathione S-transferase